MVMNWKTYKNLPPSLQKEYDFRFSEDMTLSLKELVGTVGMMVSSMFILLFILYIIVKEPELEMYKAQLTLFVSSIGSIVFFTGLIVVAILLEYIVRIIVRVYQYVKWKKDNNIVEIYWWNRWLT